jgi:hypothetical protein
MGKLIELLPDPPFCSIPLKDAVYCENCNTISNSRPFRCGVCSSEAVLRVAPIFDRDPEPAPAAATPPRAFFLLRAIGA